MSKLSLSAKIVDFSYEFFKALSSNVPYEVDGYSRLGSNLCGLCGITITDNSGGKTLTFNNLHPSMIARNGFYEGKETNYRLEPQEIIDFFGLPATLSSERT